MTEIKNLWVLMKGTVEFCDLVFSPPRVFGTYEDARDAMIAEAREEYKRHRHRKSEDGYDDDWDETWIDDDHLVGVLVSYGIGNAGYVQWMIKQPQEVKP